MSLTETATQLPPEAKNAPVSVSVGLKGILELKPEYLRVADPTEYAFATRYVGSWAEWEAFCESPEGAQVVTKWRSELAAKLRSKAFARLQDVAEGETRDAINANKYIYEELEDKTKVGRPTKEHINQEAKKLVADRARVEEDYVRLLGPL